MTSPHFLCCLCQQLSVSTFSFFGHFHLYIIIFVIIMGNIIKTLYKVIPPNPIGNLVSDRKYAITFFDLQTSCEREKFKCKMIYFRVVIYEEEQCCTVCWFGCGTCNIFLAWIFQKVRIFAGTFSNGPEYAV